MDRNLTDYLPLVLKDVSELKAIMEAEQPEAEKIWAGLDDALNDQFVADSTANGVARLESILKITPKATETLDARKFRILTRLTEQLPYTVTTLKQQLAGLCGEDGYSFTVNNATYTLTVLVALIAKSNFDDVDALLQRMVPANLVIDLSLKYNQLSALTAFTHGHLRAYTHYNLRNEVIS